MKRTLAFILLILITISIIVSCTSKEEEEGLIKKVETVASTETDVLDARKNVPDNLPELDFGGARFKVVTHIEGDVIPTRLGEIVNDTILERNLEIEERFNVKIKVHGDPNVVNINDYAAKAVQSGDDEFDLFAGMAAICGRVVVGDYLMPWQNIKYVDFTQKWWSKSTTDDLTVNGKTYTAIGDFSFSSLYCTMCMYYDKFKAADYGLPDIYDLVNSGKWTFDMVSSLVKDVYSDLNGNGVKDPEDYFGLVSDPYTDVTTYLWAFDNPVMRKNAEGIPELSIKTGKISTICEKLYEFLFNNPSTFCDYNYAGVYGKGTMMGCEFFELSKCLFTHGTLQLSTGRFRGIENDYGIIPYPKFDESQERYMTMAEGSHTILAVPKTATNTDMIGVITEALCAENWKRVFPVYYDVALKVKGVRDPQSIEMLDIIVDGRVTDFGYIYDGWAGMSFCLEEMFEKGNTNFESYYAANESKVRLHYENILRYFN